MTEHTRQVFLNVSPDKLDRRVIEAVILKQNMFTSLVRLPDGNHSVRRNLRDIALVEVPDKYREGEHGKIFRKHLAGVPK